MAKKITYKGKMIELTKDELLLITKVLQKESGICYDEKKKYLIESRLNERLETLNLSSFYEYIRLVSGTHRSAKEVGIMISAVTTNETSFFRNADQIDVLVNNIIPEIIKKNRASGKKIIRIWSAASSTGDEIRSISIAIKEAIRIPSDIVISLYASDINEDVLDVARRGICTKYSIRNTPKEYLRKYFTPTDDGYSLTTERLHPVNFKKINLITPPYPLEFRGFDIVFCANVLIYFGKQEKQVALAGIHSAMEDDGYLFLGHSESLHNVTSNYEMTSINGIPTYRKIDV